ncbi:hypothetical protein [Moraxella lacunata]|uniref:hypothetical protein n=1 Tax=Moraxella lacunata TaxID=477 RepID=UPI000B002959
MPVFDICHKKRSSKKAGESPVFQGKIIRSLILGKFLKFFLIFKLSNRIAIFHAKIDKSVKFSSYFVKISSMADMSYKHSKM